MCVQESVFFFLILVLGACCLRLVCVSIGRELCLVCLGCLAGWAGVFFPDTMSRVLLTFL